MKKRISKLFAMLLIFSFIVSPFSGNIIFAKDDFDGYENDVVSITKEGLLTYKETPTTTDFIGEIPKEVKPYITVLSIPSGIELQIGLFEGFTGLTTVTLPEDFDGIIPIRCFKNCEKLETLNSTNPITEVRKQGFENTFNNGNANINIENISRIDEEGFSNSFNNLKETNLSFKQLIYAYNKAFLGSFNDCSDCSITFDKIKNFGLDNSAFYYEDTLNGVSESAVTNYNNVGRSFYNTFNNCNDINVKFPALTNITNMDIAGGIALSHNGSIHNVRNNAAVFANSFNNTTNSNLYFPVLENIGSVNYDSGSKISEFGDFANFACNSDYLLIDFPEATTMERCCFHSDFKNASSLTLNLPKMEAIPIQAFASAFQETENLNFKLPKVVSIGPSAFYNSGIKDISSFLSLTKIEKYAFSYAKIESADVTNIKEIGEKAFAKSSISQLDGLSNSIEQIGKEAFSNCDNLISLDLSNFSDLFSKTNMSKYGSGLFLDCNKLNVVNYPNASNGYIPISLFEGCVGMKSFSIPASYVQIGERAYANSGIETFDVTESVNALTINEKAFYNTKIQNISFANQGQVELYKDSFGNCFYLKTVSCKDMNAPILVNGAFNGSSLQSFYGSANTNLPVMVINGFENCKNLTTFDVPFVVFPTGPNEKNAAFKNCTSLKKITVFRPFSMIGTTAIPSQAFSGCSSLETVDLNGVETIGAEAFKDCNSKNLSLNLSSVMSVGDGAFKNANLGNCIKSTNLTDFSNDSFQDSIDKNGYFLSKNIKPTINTTSLDGKNDWNIAERYAIVFDVIGSDSLNTAAKSFFQNNNKTYAFTKDEFVTNVSVETATCETAISEISQIKNYLNVKTTRLDSSTVEETNYDIENLTYDGVAKTLSGNVIYKLKCNNISSNATSRGRGEGVYQIWKCPFVISTYICNEITCINLSTKNISLEEDEKTNITYEALPKSIFDKSVFWVSSNAKVAKVSPEGVVTGIGEGTATITCYYRRNMTVYESCEVSVTPKTDHVYNTLFGSEKDKEKNIEKYLNDTDEIISSNESNANTDDTSIVNYNHCFRFNIKDNNENVPDLDNIHYKIESLDDKPLDFRTEICNGWLCLYYKDANSISKNIIVTIWSESDFHGASKRYTLIPKNGIIESSEAGTETEPIEANDNVAFSLITQNNNAINLFNTNSKTKNVSVLWNIEPLDGTKNTPVINATSTSLDHNPSLACSLDFTQGENLTSHFNLICTFGNNKITKECYVASGLNQYLPTNNAISGVSHSQKDKCIVPLGTEVDTNELISSLYKIEGLRNNQNILNNYNVSINSYGDYDTSTLVDGKFILNSSNADPAATASLKISCPKLAQSTVLYFSKDKESELAIDSPKYSYSKGKLFIKKDFTSLTPEIRSSLQSIINYVDCIEFEENIVNVPSIIHDVFSGFTFDSVIIPETAETLPELFLSGCKVGTVTIKSSKITIIPESCFDNATIDSMDLSKLSNIENIADYAFQSLNCKNIILPNLNNVKTIGKSAFIYMKAPNAIIDFSNNKYIESLHNLNNSQSVFMGMTANKVILDNCENLNNIGTVSYITINKWSMKDCPFMRMLGKASGSNKGLLNGAFTSSSIKHIVLPDSLSCLMYNAFSSIDDLQLINLEKVKVLGQTAFNYINENAGELSVLDFSNVKYMDLGFGNSVNYYKNVDIVAPNDLKIATAGINGSFNGTPENHPYYSDNMYQFLSTIYMAKDLLPMNTYIYDYSSSSVSTSENEIKTVEDLDAIDNDMYWDSLSQTSVAFSSTLPYLSFIGKNTPSYKSAYNNMLSSVNTINGSPLYYLEDEYIKSIDLSFEDNIGLTTATTTTVDDLNNLSIKDIKKCILLMATMADGSKKEITDYTLESYYYDKDTMELQGKVKIKNLPKENPYIGNVSYLTNDNYSNVEIEKDFSVDGVQLKDCIYAVNGIALNKHKVEAIKNDNIQLNAALSPKKVDVDKVIWNSSNETIAAVSETGTVTMVSEGSATIYAMSLDGGYMDTCEITVKKKDVPIVTSSPQKSSNPIIIPSESPNPTIAPSNAPLHSSLPMSSSLPLASGSPTPSYLPQQTQKPIVTSIPIDTQPLETKIPVASSQPESSFNPVVSPAIPQQSIAPTIDLFPDKINQTANRPNNKKVTGNAAIKAIELKIPTIIMKKNMAKKSKFKINLINTKGAKINCASSNTKLATINKLGIVTTKKKTGKCTLIINVVKGNKKIQYLVNLVIKNKCTGNYSLRKIKTKYKYPSVALYKQVPIGKKYNIKMKHLQKAIIKYRTNNKKVAIVNKKGKVTPIASGRADITINIKQNKISYQYTLVVRVTKKGVKSNISYLKKIK